MKKGIFFALLFGALFLLLFSIIVFYSANISEREKAAIENNKIRKFAFIAGDISADLLSFLQVRSVSLKRNSTHMLISINESMPLGYPAPQAELLSYRDFIEGEYAGKQNLGGKLLLNTDAIFVSPFIYFNNLDFNYSYSGLAKNEALFKGSSSVSAYSVRISSATESFRECGWQTRNSGTMGVRITVIAANCPIQSVFLDPNSESKFWANTSSGKYLNLSIGKVEGNPFSVKISANGIKIDNFLNVTAASSQPVVAWLPVRVNFVGEYELQTLSISEN